MSNTPTFYGQYGLTGGSPRVIISQLVPTSSSKIQADLGTILIYEPTNSIYILAGYNNDGTPIWSLVETSGGSGVFDGLTNTGLFTQTGIANINTTGTSNTNIGNAGNTTDILSGSTNIVGTVDINTSGSDVTTIGNLATGGDIFFDSAASIESTAASITLNNTGTGLSSIGNTLGGLVEIQAAPASGIAIGTGSATACNILILAGLGSSANMADTFNSKVGSYVLSNAAFSTLAAGTSAVFTMTNSSVLNTSTGCIATASTVSGSNNVPLAVSVQVTTNTLTFVIQNTTSATAVNGNVILNFWVLN